MFDRNNSEPIAAPEWAVSSRQDFALDEQRLGGGWGTSSSPLSRGSAYTDLMNHEMSAPEGDSDIARAIRYHELTHARFSPVHVPKQLCDQLGISVETVRVAEEMRINLITTTMDNRYYGGLPRAEEHSEIAQLTKKLTDNTEGASADFANANKDFRKAVYLMYATYGLDVFRTVKRRLKLNKEWAGAIEGIAKHLRNNYHLGRSYAGGEIGSTVPDTFAYMDSRTPRQVVLPRGFIDFTVRVATEIESIIANGGAGRGDRYQPSDEGGVDGDEERSAEKRRAVGAVSSVPWEGLRLGITSLTEPTAVFMGRRKRPAITGKAPRRPDRLLTDPERRIFTETVRGAGGIVVFDCSGSMGVAHDVIRRTTALFAGATVLAYTNAMDRSGSESNAWVLARNGRMISETDMNKLRLNRGNGCDGEALRWAVRNKRKGDFILWVSDVGVTGHGDAQTHEMIVDCAELVRRHGIIQVNDTEAAVEMLSEMKRSGRLPHGLVQDSTLKQYVANLTDGTQAPVYVPVINQR